MDEQPLGDILGKALEVQAAREAQKIGMRVAPGFTPKSVSERSDHQKTYTAQRSGSTLLELAKSESADRYIRERRRQEASAASTR
jgi:hypothetical protein